MAIENSVPSDFYPHSSIVWKVLDCHLYSVTSVADDFSMSLNKLSLKP